MGRYLMSRVWTALLFLALVGVWSAVVGLGDSDSTAPGTAAPRAVLPAGGAHIATIMVRRVKDGDTFVSQDGITNRLIGVDTPETVKPGTPVQCYGPEASAHLHSLLATGDTLRVEVGQEPTDRYGRRLIYAWEGRLFVNAEIIEEGYGKVLTIKPNTKYVAVFKQAQAEAKAAHRGLWSHC